MNRPKLYKQVVNKELPIVKTLYPGYLLFFLFNNATSYSVFIQDILNIIQMNKKTKKNNLGYAIDGLKKTKLVLYNPCFFKKKIVLDAKKEFNKY